ncbi:N-acetyltransferase [Soonwooa sp.]|uniref:N-acetyltransferase n=1 Tax=Soonwooa sp. TaxID=1938592 RepID=UPI002633609A|nr:N-acetyltransferase [Soonwooa sp.]
MRIIQASTKDFDELTSIWLDASIKAHDFITTEYWSSKVDEMKNVYLPASKTWISENDSHEILGFVSMLENHIAALFISPKHQSKGAGTQLLNFIKSKYNSLTLNVYEKNLQAFQFYKKHDFKTIEEALDEETGEKDVVMEWTKNN